jgi:fibronectin-binding autotransporter adhesin
VLNGANAYSGGTFVNGGTVRISSDGNLGTGSLALNNRSRLDVTASGVFSHDVLIQGAPTLNVASGHSIAWTGRISDNDAAGSLDVSGGGSVALTNAANWYSGATSVSGGSTLVISDDRSLGAPAGGIALGWAATAP